MRVIERFTRRDADALDYEFTIDDAETFTSSWTAAWPMQRLEGLLYEYACHEGNYAMSGILRGARVTEQSEVEGR